MHIGVMGNAVNDGTIEQAVSEARQAAEAMIGNVLVTKQTGPGGRRVSRVYVEAGCDIKRELYLSLLVDRETGRVTVVASTEGGMEIEEVAATKPDRLARIAIDPLKGVDRETARSIAEQGHLPENALDGAAELLEKETLDQNQLAEIFKDVKKLPPRPQWLSSERRPVSDLPAVAVPQPKAPIDAGAVDGGVDSGDGAKPERKRAPRIKPRPATA